MHEFRFPDVGEGIHDGELVEWLVKEGDIVKEHQIIAKVETDKAIVEIPSPKSGKIARLYFKKGDKINVGEVMATIDDGANENVPAKSFKKEGQVNPTKEKKQMSVVGEISEATGILAMPAIRKYAVEKNVDLTKVTGTGPLGRITKEDVEKAAGIIVKKKEEPVTKEIFEKRPKILFEIYGKVLRLPFKGLRKQIATNLTRSKNMTVPVTTMDEVDVSDLFKLRMEQKDIAEKKGFRLTFLPYIARAAAIALKEHPYVNASIDYGNDEIVLKKYYNIGFAVDTNDGLIVAVVKNVDNKSILDIAKEMTLLSEQARDRTINFEDMKGGTFTLTNIGTVGSLFSTPVLNYPEAAILGIGRIYEKPVVEDSKIVIRKVMPLSLTFDHNVIDGVKATRFLNDLMKHLEDPNLMLIESD